MKKERDLYEFSIEFLGAKEKNFVSTSEDIVVIDEDKVEDFNRGISNILDLMREYSYTGNPCLIWEANNTFFNGPLENIVSFIQEKISCKEDYVISFPPYHQEVVLLPSGDTTLKTEVECLNSFTLVPKGKVPVFKIFIGKRIPTPEEVKEKERNERFDIALEKILAQDRNSFRITKEEWNWFLRRTKNSPTYIKKITYVGFLKPRSVESFLQKKKGQVLLKLSLNKYTKISSIEELKIILGVLMYREKSTSAPSWEEWKKWENSHFFWSAWEYLDGENTMLLFGKNVFSLEFGKKDI